MSFKSYLCILGASPFSDAVSPIPCFCVVVVFHFPDGIDISSPVEMSESIN